MSITFKVTASAAILTIFLPIFCSPANAQVLAEGAETVENFIAYRARSFNNTGGRELFVGVPDLGIGANRSETDFVWSNDRTTLFTVEYSTPLDTAFFSAENAQTQTTRLVDFPNWLARANSIKNVNLDRQVLNYMTITVTVRDVDQIVLITDMQLNDTPLQDSGLSLIGAVNTGENAVTRYSISDFCFVNNDWEGFVLAGKLTLSGGFSNSQERSKVDFAVGYDPNGPVCSDSVFRDDYESVANFPA